jgi:hypothetical protein
MFARGKLGNNAAIFAVNIELRGDNAGQNFATIHDNGGGRFITRRLDSQNARWHVSFLRFSQ